ncbi:hypothetical protein AAFF_G00237970 [Aldrovandia affinis]|uniref:Uncharacterized protein n=1 Tax=Aldrovandia affinis TaxID=143900 RepID=A0AAD7REV5_9TELE|nr:hypothetical protein AAFF_G00237970 [Aldrovandia affinis]
MQFAVVSCRASRTLPNKKVGGQRRAYGEHEPFPRGSSGICRVVPAEPDSCRGTEPTGILGKANPKGIESVTGLPQRGEGTGVPQQQEHHCLSHRGTGCRSSPAACPHRLQENFFCLAT